MMRKRGTIRVLFATVFVVLLAALVAGGASAGDGDHHTNGDAAKQVPATQATAAPTPAAVVAGATVTTVASGLDNPRDLAFGPDGRLYVAEAGHGGPFCAPGGHEGGGDTCAGFTSRNSWIDQGTGMVNPVVDGIISLADSHGFRATGVDSVSRHARQVDLRDRHGIRSRRQEGFLRPVGAGRAKSRLGRLIRVDGAFFQFVADVGGFDFAWAALHGGLIAVRFPDANPYGVLALPNETWVVDAGANTLDRVRLDGSWTSSILPEPAVVGCGSDVRRPRPGWCALHWRAHRRWERPGCVDGLAVDCSFGLAGVGDGSYGGDRLRFRRRRPVLRR
jgi:hypothetical protein